MSTPPIEAKTGPRFAPEVPREDRPPLVQVPDLYGDGNAVMLVARCQKAARRAGWSRADTEAFRKWATRGLYDDVLETVLEWFEEKDEEDP